MIKYKLHRKPGKAGIRAVPRIMRTPILCLLLGVIALPGYTQVATPTLTASTQALSIPAQNLNNALLNFAEQTRIQLIYDVAIVQGLRSTSLEGQYTVRDGISRLLMGTGISVTFVNQTTV
ncbi:MAG: STN domain-containing protein, partial [Pseudomonadota bacterium]